MFESVALRLPHTRFFLLQTVTYVSERLLPLSPVQRRERGSYVQATNARIVWHTLFRFPTL